MVALLVLFALLVADVDDDRGHPGRCAPAVAGTVDPGTCLPYGRAGAAAAGTNHSASSARKPAQKQPKAPAAPKAPPVRLTK
ncbi:hypothetical protein [Streptomyces sp. NPDC059455]|uniref:hypothetical protein n=1 Tax=Streptomyces sp. NPDC059455 TaxID=3346837 RepID=UPI0036B7CCDC